MSATTYRPDIDGLRAIAVAAVIMFHYGFGVPGGYVGVDVFFVISGYLITDAIHRATTDNKFSLAQFWMRRIRRIVPASAVMCTTVLVAGYFLLFPTDYTALAKSAVAHQLIRANHYFWQNTGYFSEPANNMPLLHTWSLAVEEQFYLGYPLLLLAVLKLDKKRVLTWLTLLTLLSFSVGAYCVKNHPSAAFYLAPSRAWELLLGALLCFFPNPSRLSSTSRSVLNTLSFVVLIGTFFLYDEKTSFPGVHALPPCIAAANLIYVNRDKVSFPATILSSRPLVTTGLISYSFYLWHWPILAFLRYCFDNRLSVGQRLLCVGLIFILSYASWRWIEIPFRQSTRATARTVFAFAMPPGVIITAIAVISRNGYPGRMPEDATAILNTGRDSKAFLHEVSTSQVERNELPHFGTSEAKNRALIWGDSHAMALVPALDSVGQSQQFTGRQATVSSTPPLLGFSASRSHQMNALGPAFNAAVFTHLKTNPVDVVVLAASWLRYSTPTEVEPYLEETITALRSTGARVVIVLDIPTHSVNVPREIARHAFWHLQMPLIRRSHGEYIEAQGAMNDVIMKVAKGKAYVFDPKPYLSDHAGNWLAVHDGVMLYRDSDHLSIEGASRLIPGFSVILSAAFARAPSTDSE